MLRQIYNKHLIVAFVFFSLSSHFAHDARSQEPKTSVTVCPILNIKFDKTCSYSSLLLYEGIEKESQVQDCSLLRYDACCKVTNVSGHFFSPIFSPQNGIFV